MSSNVTRSNSEANIFGMNNKSDWELGLIEEGVELRKATLLPNIDALSGSFTPDINHYRTPTCSTPQPSGRPTMQSQISEVLGHHRRRQLIEARYNCEEEPRTFERNFGRLTIRFNPVVTIVSIILIWSFVIVAIARDKEMNETMSKAKTWITQTWTWLYIGAFDTWLIFVLVIFFSKYSNIKLGRDDETAEFSDTSYFTMLFAAGVGPGLFYFAVAEPIQYYAGSERNRYNVRNITDNERATYAINLTFLHWGFHAWSVYVVVGMLLALMTYRYDLPMTIRTCFYPLLGKRIFGTMGDIIDIFSVVCTMLGVCTSLGLGVIQLNSGIVRVFPSIPPGMESKVVTIWIITALATISVVSGMKAGIKLLSLICFMIGMGILTTIFFYDDTFGILNVFVETLGAYFGNFFFISFATDGFHQMNNSIDGHDASKWMDSWTIFYWGWWVSWSPFVGMFIAKISRGRTIRDFILYTLTIPCIYVFFWFTVFGTVSIKMEREAHRLGMVCINQTSIPEKNGSIYLLSCRGTSEMLFDVVSQYENLEYFLQVVCMISLLLYFVTSSDSGSLIIDCLTSNGDTHPPVLQRIFWSLTEGACATALIIAGGQEALNALRSVSICAGLIYTMVLNFMCLALWRSLRIEAGDINPSTPEFVVDILEPFYEIKDAKTLLKYLMAIFVPFYALGHVAQHAYEEIETPKRAAKYSCIIAIPFLVWIALMLMSIWWPGLIFLGWTSYLGFAVYVTGVRSTMRERYSIIGNIVQDFFTVLIVYPLAVLQMLAQAEFDETVEKQETEEGGYSYKRHRFLAKTDVDLALSAFDDNYRRRGRIIRRRETE